MNVPNLSAAWGRPCEACKQPVNYPTNRYMDSAFCFGDKIWHSRCVPSAGLTGTFVSGYGDGGAQVETPASRERVAEPTTDDARVERSRKALREAAIELLDSSTGTVDGIKAAPRRLFDALRKALHDDADGVLNDLCPAAATAHNFGDYTVEPPKRHIPEGWKLVPVEPTGPMLYALGNLRARGALQWKNSEAWAAMLQVTPPAPEGRT